MHTVLWWLHVASCGFRTFQDTYLDKALLMLKTVGSGGSGGKGWKPAWQTGEVKVHVTWNWGRPKLSHERREQCCFIHLLVAACHLFQPLPEAFSTRQGLLGLSWGSAGSNRIYLWSWHVTMLAGILTCSSGRFLHQRQQKGQRKPGRIWKKGDVKEGNAVIHKNVDAIKIIFYILMQYIAYITTCMRII